MNVCPKERCVWASGGVCVIPCMEKADYNRAARKKAEHEALLNAAYERARRNKMVTAIAAYSTPECDQVLALRRKHKAKNIMAISTEDIEAFLNELKERS